MNEFWLCFVPLFVAVDAFGVLPFFVSLTDGIPPARRRAIMIQSLLTASAVALAFLVGGPWLLTRLGITVPDFMIAGGLVLLAFSLVDLLGEEKRPDRSDPETVGAVPIGVPLICGPAVLTTSVLLAHAHGIVMTGASLLLNIGITGLVFWFSGPLTRLLGHAGSRTVSKIASILLAAIAVMLMRKGILDTIQAALAR